MAGPAANFSQKSLGNPWKFCIPNDSVISIKRNTQTKKHQKTAPVAKKTRFL
jgi:hypothetical protein